MPYEGFVPTTKRRKGMYISIQKSGQLGISLEAHEQFFKDNSFVSYLFDKESNTIALRPTNEETEATYKIREYRQGQGYMVSGKNFLAYCGIEHPRTKKFLPVEREVLLQLDGDKKKKIKVVEIDLNKPL